MRTIVNLLRDFPKQESKNFVRSDLSNWLLTIDRSIEENFYPHFFIDISNMDINEEDFIILRDEEAPGFVSMTTSGVVYTIVYNTDEAQVLPNRRGLTRQELRVYEGIVVPDEVQMLAQERIALVDQLISLDRSRPPRPFEMDNANSAQVGNQNQVPIDEAIEGEMVIEGLNPTQPPLQNEAPAVPQAVTLHVRPKFTNIKPLSVKVMDDLVKFEDFLKEVQLAIAQMAGDGASFSFQMSNLLDMNVSDRIEMSLQLINVMEWRSSRSTIVQSNDDWKSWSNTDIYDLLRFLQAQMTAEHQQKQAPNDIARELRKTKIVISKDRRQMSQYQDKMMDLMRRLGVTDIKNFSSPELVTWLDTVIKNPMNSFEFINITEAEVMSHLLRIHTEAPITTIWSLWAHTNRIREGAVKALVSTKAFFPEFVTESTKARSEHSSQRPEKRTFSACGGESSTSGGSVSKRAQVTSTTTSTTPVQCHGCGKRHGGECLMKSHPQYNSNPNIAFTASQGCQALRRRTDKPNAQRVSQLPLWTASRSTDNWLDQDTPTNKEFKFALLRRRRTRNKVRIFPTHFSLNLYFHFIH